MAGVTPRLLGIHNSSSRMGHIKRHKTMGYWKDVEVSNHDQFQSNIDLREVNAYWIQTAKNGI
jgi:hypothetical protein